MCDVTIFFVCALTSNFPFPFLRVSCPTPQSFAVATLTERINRLTAHLAKNKHDTHCKRQLLLLSSRRRRLLQYMVRKDYHSYRLMVNELALRPVPVIGSKHVPKVRVESHKQIIERNKRLKNRTSRGDRGH